MGPPGITLDGGIDGASDVLAGDADGAETGDGAARDGDQDGEGVDGDAPEVDSGERTCEALRAEALLLEGFEDPSLIGWSQLTDNGTIVQTSDEVFRGSGALSAEVTRRLGAAYVSRKSFGPVTTGDLYVRAWLFASSAASLSSASLLIVGDSVPPFSSVAFEPYGADSHASVLLMENSERVSSSTPIPLDTWFCVQIHMRFGAEDGAVDLWLDGELVASGSPLHLAGGAGYDTVTVGIAFPEEDVRSAHLYADELAISTEPLPCDC